MWCGYCVSSSITAVRWKYNKIMNVISTFIGKQHYCHREKRRGILNNQTSLSNVICPRAGGVDCMNQNISAYMINLRKKKWWW